MQDSAVEDSAVELVEVDSSRAVAAISAPEEENSAVEDSESTPSRCVRQVHRTASAPRVR